MLKRLPWLIAAFRAAIAKNNDEAERARNALEALDALDLAETRQRTVMG